MTSNVPTDSSFLGKRALVTGGASGIGLATVELLRSRGAKVGAIDIKGCDSGDWNYEGDISDTNGVSQIVTQFISDAGGLDILVLAAGINGPAGRVDEIHPDEVRHLMEVNVISVFNFVFASLKHLQESQGNIVLVGSINGSRSFGWAGASPYVASKAAVMALGRNFATEMGPRNVRINTVCPGATDTDIHTSTKWRGEYPVGRRVHYPEGSMPLTGKDRATPLDVAHSIAFLASDAASHITGTEIFIDAGQSLI
jgi:NAD(P)-dependent dehydrogenase (short-subunit alcohol dehydrogenase family)